MKRTDMSMLVLSCFLLIYFTAQVINSNFIHYSSAITGAIQELFTIPLICLQIYVFFYSAFRLKKDNKKTNRNLLGALIVSSIGMLMLILIFSGLV